MNSEFVVVLNEAREAVRQAAHAVIRLQKASEAVRKLAPLVQQALAAKFPDLDVRIAAPTEWMTDLGRTASGIEKYGVLEDIPVPCFSVYVVMSKRAPWLLPWPERCSSLQETQNWYWANTMGEAVKRVPSVSAAEFAVACAQLETELGVAIGLSP